MILKILLLPLLAVLTLSPLAAAQTSLSSEQLASIAGSCVQAQVNLQRVQYSDTAARINSGRAYESLVSNLLAPFNSRLALNRVQAAQALTAITSDFERVFDDYKQNYTTYEDALERTLTIGCVDNPAEFYTRLETTRQARAQLRSDVMAMNQSLVRYQQDVTAIATRQSSTTTEGLR